MATRGRQPCARHLEEEKACGRVRFLSDEEREALFRACAASCWPPLHTLVLLAISTAARRGELIHLKWADVDLKTACATVQETKDGEPRVLPSVGKAREALYEFNLQGSARGKWVVPQPSGLPGAFENFDAVWPTPL